MKVRQTPRLGETCTIRICPQDFATEILVSPFADDWFFDLVQQEMEKFELATRVEWSSLRFKPSDCATIKGCLWISCSHGKEGLRCQTRYKAGRGSWCRLPLTPPSKKSHFLCCKRQRKLSKISYRLTPPKWKAKYLLWTNKLLKRFLWDKRDRKRKRINFVFRFFDLPSPWNEQFWMVLLFWELWSQVVFERAMKK